MNDENKDGKREIKFDITSSAIESSLDLAKGFVEKLVNPSVEELGLLIKDRISFWRFSNQVKILNKAKNICEKNNISIKSISPKILCPYLENASLEEDEELQDKWAALLVNMVDSNENVQNHVFPYILSQLSKEEFLFIESKVNENKLRILNLENELTIHFKSKESKEKFLTSRINSLKEEIKGEPYSDQRLKVSSEIRELQKQLREHQFFESRTMRSIKQHIEIKEKDLKGFEVANIIRLGLAKVVYEVIAGTQSINIPEETGQLVDFDIDIDNDVKTIITELGEIFIEACQNKRDSLQN